MKIPTSDLEILLGKETFSSGGGGTFAPEGALIPPHCLKNIFDVELNQPKKNS